MVKSRPFLARELTKYPMGGRRIWLLFIVLLANFIASYEAQISPVVPLLLKDLHLTLTEYGEIVALSTIVSAISAFIFGPVADKYGRVRVLIPSLFLTAFCVYGLGFVGSVSGFIVMRILLSFVDGMSISSTAGLVRDYSPRMGRALAYGFWTFGPVGSNFFAAAVAGWTLPIFQIWQSQFYIQGTISLLAAILILFNLTDISPQLRARIIHSQEHAAEINEKIKEDVSAAHHGKMAEIIRIPRMWTLTFGISLFLLTYLTMQSFGPTLLVQAFHFKVAQAASIAKYFWLLNLVTLLLAGYISDRLMLRKIVSLFGAVLTLGYLVYFISLFGKPVSEGQMIVYASLLGGLMGIAYGPWMALFSENAEDIKASLQSAAWGLYGFVIRVVAVCSAMITPILVAKSGWGSWMWVAQLVGLIYIPLLFTAKGSWLKSGKAALNQPNHST